MAADIPSETNAAAPAPEGGKAPPASGRAWWWGAAVGVVLLGAALRLHHLGVESLWRDEGTSVLLAQSDVPQILADRARMCHAPLYFVLLHEWVGIAGTGEAAVRLLSAIFGIACLPMIMALAGRLLRNRWAALASAFLMAVAPVQIYHSQEARMYCMAVFLAMASMFFFVALLRRDRAWDLIGYLLCTALLVYTHNSAWFVVLVQNAAVIVYRPRSGPHRGIRNRRWVLGQVVLAGLFAPWGLYTACAPRTQTLTGGVEYDELLSGLVSHAGSSPLLIVCAAASLIFFLRLRAGTGAPQPPAPEGGRSVLRWLRRLESDPAGKGYFLLAWLLTAEVVLGLAACLFGFQTKPRYGLVGSPALYVMVGGGLAMLPKLSLRVALTAGLAALSAVQLHDYYGVRQKEQWREVAAFIESRARPGDVVLFTVKRREWYIRACYDYYGRRQDLVKGPFPKMVRMPDGHKTLPDDWAGAGKDRLWVVVITGHMKDFRTHFRALKEQGFGIGSETRFEKLRVRVYERRGVSAPAPGEEPDAERQPPRAPDAGPAEALSAASS